MHNVFTKNKDIRVAKDGFQLPEESLCMHEKGTKLWSKFYLRLPLH
jgi:hypothetical protein